jgi:hypothetical protein
MLASITPLGERGRGRNWNTTIAFYVIGSVLGGATRGAVLGTLGAAIPASLQPSSTEVALLLATLLTFAAAIEAGWLRMPIPSLARQVNEDWLDRYRGWVIGFGFGYQLGLAVVVYITTASLWVVFIAEILTFSPMGGLALGALFGLIRSLPIFATRRVRSPQELRQAHRTMNRMAPIAERTLTAACGVAAVFLVVMVIV